MMVCEEKSKLEVARLGGEKLPSKDALRTGWWRLRLKEALTGYLFDLTIQRWRGDSPNYMSGILFRTRWFRLCANWRETT